MTVEVRILQSDADGKEHNRHCGPTRLPTRHGSGKWPSEGGIDWPIGMNAILHDLIPPLISALGAILAAYVARKPKPVKKRKTKRKA